MTVYKFKLDFEVGNLVKSPCRDCKYWKEKFPKCVGECKLINKIQTVLAETRPYSKG